jgi:hypothetical protein
MPHVKRKRIRGNEYYYLVRNYRRGGKVKTKTLQYLGKEPPSAEELTRLREQHGRPGEQMSLALTSRGAAEDDQANSTDSQTEGLREPPQKSGERHRSDKVRPYAAP